MSTNIFFLRPGGGTDARPISKITPNECQKTRSAPADHGAKAPSKYYFMFLVPGRYLLKLSGPLYEDNPLKRKRSSLG